MKYCSILHGRVFVMFTPPSNANSLNFENGDRQSLEIQFSELCLHVARFCCNVYFRGCICIVRMASQKIDKKKKWPV